MTCAILLAISVVSCESAPKGEPLASLCVLDFEAKMCWVHKEVREGFSFSEMNDLGAPTWFALDEKDLGRIQKALNR